MARHPLWGAARGAELAAASVRTTTVRGVGVDAHGLDLLAVQHGEGGGATPGAHDKEEENGS